ncbi:hypothetical protein [Natronobacterium texcoconense]|uniref:Uncharacterized protein n=1 Tax=Natronobacterium texcoconense TaxID=1095778 RepID=A0A1H1FMZ9_NATTX|nr:hypothetical protein [Natronobacterium texcoconense]SDR02109.1 hypothetical protein SAMN04489842_2029 [Natronobacterium texcoconense]
MKRRRLLAVGGTLAVTTLAGCTGGAPGDIEIVDDTLTDSSSYTFEAEPGYELIIEFALRRGTFAHADLLDEDENRIMYEQTDRGELEHKETLEDGGTYHLEVVTDGWVNARIGLAT